MDVHTDSQLVAIDFYGHDPIEYLSACILNAII